MIKARIRPLPRRAAKRRIVRPRRIRQGKADALSLKRPLKRMVRQARPSSNPKRPTVRDLPPACFQRGQHRPDALRRPLGDLIQQKQFRRGPVQPPRIASQDSDHRPGRAVCYRRPIRRILNPESTPRPDAVFLEGRLKEVKHMAESDQALVEATCDQEALGHRFNERPAHVYRRASDSRCERGLAVAPAHAQGGVIRLPECARQEPPLPGKQLEALAGIPALADHKALDVISYRFELAHRASR